MSALLQLADALEKHCHLERTLLKEERLSPLVADRQRALGLASADAYARHVEHHADELDLLRDMIAVPETWLFRYSESFELLKNELPARRAPPVTALSVACAIGAEPYSVVATALAAGVPAAQVRVHALDSSAAALAVAETGSLSRLAARERIPEWAAQWFAPNDNGVTVAACVRDRVQFARGTVPQALAALGNVRFDAIFCRNLAIYLAPAARKTLGGHLRELLAPDGYLFLGHAEPPSTFGLSGALVPREPRATFAYTLRPAAEATHPQRAHTRARPAAKAKGAAAQRTRSAAQVPNAQPAAGAPVLPSLTEVRAAADRGHLQEALLLAAQRMHHGDRSSELLLVVGSAHAALGHDADAEGALRKVVYLEPANTEALLQLAVLSERRGNHAQADRYRMRAARTTGEGDAA